MTAPGGATPTMVYQQVIADGGSQEQGLVAASLVDGIESDGSPTELAGGIGPAEGLFQFEPDTWTGGAGGGKNGLPADVGDATWQQQVLGFLNDSAGNNFSAWGPDLGSTYGSGVSTPLPGSSVANDIAKNSALWESGQAEPADGTVTGSGSGAAATQTGFGSVIGGILGIPSPTSIETFLAKAILVVGGVGILMIAAYTAASPSIKGAAEKAAPFAELAAA